MPRQDGIKVLKVNLTDRKIAVDLLDPAYIENFLGGRVLGDYFLYKELQPLVDPLSPDNVMIFSAGPLTGSSAPGCSRYVLHTKSPLTGIFNCSLAGGRFGPELRKTGFEMVMISGKADKPVYLRIIDNDVQIIDAENYWGLKTSDFQELIKRDLNDSQVAIACIGPAGENQCLYASVINERRAAGRGGGGAVMGSKNLKALVVKGNKKVPIADRENFKAAAKKAFNEIKNHPIIGGLMPLYGSMVALPTLNEQGIMPWRNWQTCGSKKGESLYPQNWREKYVIKDMPCAAPCNVRCSILTLERQGPHAGVLNEGPEYETNYSFGACCDITDQSAIFEADALCDDYGLDTISMGVSIAFAMECFEKGIIGMDDTDGCELRFGNPALLAPLIRQTAYKAGFGKILSSGTQRMSELFGGGSADFAMHAKGMELGGYDPRSAKSLALVYACGSRGGCHKCGGSCNAQSLTELSTGEHRFANEGKAAFTKKMGNERIISDSAIMCAFPKGAVSPQTLADLLNSATGNAWSCDDLLKIADKGSQIERAFNIREGLRRDADVLPKRLLRESHPEGPIKGSTVQLDSLVDDFYSICGWDQTTGIPLPEKLEQCGLNDIARDMRECFQKKPKDESGESAA